MSCNLISCFSTNDLKLVKNRHIYSFFSPEIDTVCIKYKKGWHSFKSWEFFPTFILCSNYVLQVSSCPEIWENPEYWNQDAGAENKSTWGHGRGAKLEEIAKVLKLYSQTCSL